MGRWWSARSAARTNDLEAGEDPPHTGRPWERSKDVVVQVICCLPGESVKRGDVVARTGAQPYLGPRTMVRRHDDGWGARRAGFQRGAAAHSFRGVHPAQGWRQALCGSQPQAAFQPSQLRGVSQRRWMRTMGVFMLGLLGGREEASGGAEGPTRGGTDQRFLSAGAFTGLRPGRSGDWCGN